MVGGREIISTLLFFSAFHMQYLERFAAEIQNGQRLDRFLLLDGELT